MFVTQTTSSAPQRLAGRTAIVTGDSRGIGATVVHRLTTDGARVAVVYRNNAAKADAVVSRIHSTDAQVITIQADVGNVVSVDTMVSTIRKAFGAIDTLANSAGILENQLVGGIGLASFDVQFRTNAFSTILVIQVVLPHVPMYGEHIVSVSSSLVYRPRAGLTVYTASKAAVGILTHASAVELGPRNIAVNAVALALTRTDVTAPIPGEVKAHMRESAPIGRLAEPDDIADAVAFLALDDARWITGRTLVTDGGFV